MEQKKKIHLLERAVNCVPQVVHFILSLRAASLSRREISSAGNLDHFEAVLSNKVSALQGEGRQISGFLCCKAPVTTVLQEHDKMGTVYTVLKVT